MCARSHASDGMAHSSGTLLPVQPRKRRAHAARGRHEIARASDAAELGAGGGDPDLAAIDSGSVAGLSVLDRRARAQPERMKILFVCMGNICRSPTAEGVM